ncbi:MAG: energy transducer TonB [Acidobacteria bacterium]|nr:energy transducer TonB [Acidobacteriota bacterium]
MPQRAAAPAAPAAISAEAPQIALAIDTGNILSRLEGPATVARPQFRMPEERSSSPKAVPLPGADISAPTIGAPQQTATVIVGLDPAPARLEPPPPPGNRSAQFSAGPKTGGNGNGTLAASARAEIRVPNLAIAPAAAAAAAAPTITRPQPAGNDRSAFRKELLASLSARLPASPNSSPAKLEPVGPGWLLRGSTVYTMAVDMPNITSYEGSWTLRFTELGGGSPDDVLTSPVAMHKVDPKYTASAAAEGIEGKVLLYAVIRRDGRVDQIRLVQGIDERLDTSAVAAFSKWEFQPATKNGQPVDLEAVVQIPFRVGPRKKN